MSLGLKLSALFPSKADVNASDSVINHSGSNGASVGLISEREAASLVDSSFPSQSSQQNGELLDDRAVTSGLHGILRTTDYWFNVELGTLEREAKELAETHARAGLPRQDIPVTEEIEPERVLRGKATQVFEQWQERVRRKLHDVIADMGTSLRQDIASLRYEAEWLQHDATELKTQQSELQTVQSEEKRRLEARRAAAKEIEEKTIEYGSFLRRGLYLVLISLLVIVDWIANVPVFRELLPQDPGADRRFQNLIATTEHLTSSGGFVRLWYRISSAPESSVLAIGVVIFLLFLAHVFGASLRRWIALRSEEDKERTSNLQSHIRQARVPLIASSIGLAVVLSFLFWSRSTLKPVTETRLEKVQKSLQIWQDKQRNAERAHDITAASEARRKVTETQFELNERQQAADYAESISSMNLPIFLLNLTLVITAAAGAYLESKDRIQRTRIAALHEDAPLDGVIADKLAQIKDLRVAILQHRGRIRELDTAIRTNLGRARYLSNSNPFQDWEAKANRLDALIHIFRTTNSCLRGLDAINIRAFETRRPLDLVVMQGENFRVPEELAQFEREFSEASAESSRVMARTAEAAAGGAA